MQEQFLNVRARLVNNEIWQKLSFVIVKSQRAYKKPHAINEAALFNLLGKFAELDTLCTEKIGKSEVMEKTPAVVRDIDMFTAISQNILFNRTRS